MSLPGGKVAALRAEVVPLLRAIVGDRHVLSEDADRRVYGYDASVFRGTDVLAVTLPETTAQVAEIVKLTQRLGLAVIARGAGTGINGGALPQGPAVVIALARMNRVIRVDPGNRTCVVEPGVVNQDLKEHLARLGFGFTYVPDPGSQVVSTVGGNVGNNAGGMHCLKYGVTANHIVGLELVLPDGQIVELGGPPAGRPGMDLVPEAIVYPEAPEQVAQVLALANREQLGVVAWGVGQDIAGGRTPSRYDIALSLSRLNRVLEHDVENLTVTAQAGATLADANRHLAARHQFAALGHDTEPHTLGGIVAANRPVPRRLLYGDVRDQLLGLSVATPDGRLVRYGRKVIKNVAGYDMNKLFTGSAGMLGIVVEVTLKLFALPDERAVAIAQFADSVAGQAAAFAAAAELYRSALVPAYLLLLEHTGAEPARQPSGHSVDRGLVWLCVGAEGRSIAVRRQTADALVLMARHGGRDGQVLPALPAAALASPSASSLGEGIMLRTGVAPERLGWLADELRGLAETLGANLVRSVDYGGGLIRCHLGGAVNDKWLSALRNLRVAVEAERGYVLIERAPASVMEPLGPWGELGGEVQLMRALRQKIDPSGILTPGRYL
jgi:glycolate oxidase FAD binding subunit